MTEYFFVPNGIILQGCKFIKQTTFTEMSYFLPSLKRTPLFVNIASWLFGGKWKKFERYETHFPITTILN